MTNIYEDFFNKHRGTVMTFRTGWLSLPVELRALRGARQMANSEGVTDVKIVGWCTNAIIFQFLGNEDIGHSASIITNPHIDLALFLTGKIGGSKVWWHQNLGTLTPNNLVSAPRLPVDDPKLVRLKKPISNHPHRCPQCNASAYIGFSAIECTGIGCKNFKLRPQV